MFCYNCGNLVYNGMDKCMICGSETQIIRDLAFDSEIDKIAENIPDLDNAEKVFKIGENTIKILSRSVFAVTLNKFSSCIYDASWKELFEWITKYSFDTIIKDGVKKLESLMIATEIAGMALMKKMGCHIGSQTAEEKISCDRIDVLEMSDPFYDLKIIQDQLNDIKEGTYENIEKNYSTKKSSHWAGGGFGVTGAIKGKLTAEIMNLGETAVKGIFNSIGSYAAKSQVKGYIENAKSDIKKSFKFQLYFQLLWRDYIKKFHSTIKRLIVSELKIESIAANYNWGEDIEYDFSLYDEESAIKNLNKNVYDLNSYISLYSINKNYGKELCRIADFCGILDIVELAFLQYTDGKIIANLDKNNLGYDLSDDELLSLKKNIDELEGNNTVFQHIYVDSFDIEAKKYSADFNDLPCEKVKTFCEEYEKAPFEPNESKLIFLKLLVIREQEYSKKLSELCSTIEIKETKKEKYSKEIVLKIRENTINKDMKNICKLENICSMDSSEISKIVCFIDSAIVNRKNNYELAYIRNQLFNIMKCVGEENEESFQFFINYFVNHATSLSSEILLECDIGRKCFVYENFYNENGTLNKNNLSYIEEAVKNGNVFAMSIIGKIYLTTNGQKELGIKFIEKAAQCLEITALKEIEDWYKCGKNNYPQDEEKAEQYFMISFVMGSEEAEEKLELQQE